MKIITVNSPIVVSRVPNHDEIKSQIIDAISSLGRFSFTNMSEGQRITHTDWHISGRYQKKYAEILLPHINDHIQNVKNIFGYKIHELQAMWFQWYEEGDFHSLHTHGNCMFSSVYYLSLGAQSPSTSFVLNKQEFAVDVSEGDAITFPSFVFHQSKPNNSDQPKIVISFNSNFY